MKTKTVIIQGTCPDHRNATKPLRDYIFDAVEAAGWRVRNIVQFDQTVEPRTDIVGPDYWTATMLIRVED